MVGYLGNSVSDSLSANAINSISVAKLQINFKVVFSKKNGSQPEGFCNQWRFSGRRDAAK